MSRIVRALYPGTFDPVTNGHLDIIERGCRLFDEVTVAVSQNPEKAPLFSLEERMALLSSVTSRWHNVEIDSFKGLLVNYAVSRGASAIIRGIRAVSDFDYEFQMALMNRRLEDRLETIFLVPAEEYTYLSSSLVKEVFSLGGSVRGLVPDEVERGLLKKLGRA
ncbi:MAG: pantetheine-phosphate adenylyltransferase [Acidobacteriota bacterium]|jgi:pantetheine-phosphate adenylyltransferase